MKWLVLAAVLVSGVAQAQRAGGRSGMSTGDALTNVRAFEELRAFGRCVADGERQNALAIIATVPGSTEERDALSKYVYRERSTCLFGGTTMRMPTQFARGTIAEGLLSKGGVPDSYHLPAPAVGEAKDLHGVARCYTTGHRDEVKSVLATKPGSREETKVLLGLWDEFRKCMPDANIRLNAPWIRYLLAEAVLRLPPAAPAARN